MAATRRPAEESRALLIEAAVEMINTEGYAALSARRLAEKVGLKRQIVHYYFRTMEDLLLAVIRHYGEEGLARFRQEFEAGDPLRVLWETRADASTTSFAFMAMARHSPVIRAEVTRYLEAFRKLQVEAVASHLNENRLDFALPPEAIVMILQNVSQAVASEVALGVNRGHDVVCTAIENWLLSDASGRSPTGKMDRRSGRSGIPFVNAT